MACMKRKNITPYGTIHVLVPVTKCNLHFLSVMLFNSDDRFIYKCILIFFFSPRRNVVFYAVLIFVNAPHGLYDQITPSKWHFDENVVKEEFFLLGDVERLTLTTLWWRLLACAASLFQCL